MGLIHILTKLTYVFKTTKVSSANLNDIQDAVIELQDQWTDPADVGDVADLETTATEIVGAINEVLGDVKQGFANNLIPYPYYFTSPSTKQGVTYTPQSDGAMIATGTATANSNIQLNSRSNSSLRLPAGTYTISGCPSGGSTSKYTVNVGKVVNGAWNTTLCRDTGSGATFTLTEDTDICVSCNVYNGYACPSGGLVFYPMLEKGTVAHDYVPYNDSIGGVRRDITALASDAYDSSSTYKVGQLCIYENTLYRCNTAITTAEAWTAAHWTATTIAEEIENRVLWLPGVTVSATTGSIVSVSDSRITTDHVLASCTWASDSSITALTSWSTETAGTLTIIGTCSAATTADILLIKKNN